MAKSEPKPKHLLIVTLRDTKTGDEAPVVFYDDADPHATREDGDAMDGLEFLWRDGNFACDCNRLSFLRKALGQDQEPLECGDTRVVIVSATLDGIPLDGWKEI